MKKEETNPYALIGSRIKKIRLEKNIDKSFLAEQLDISVASIDSIERGRVKITMDVLFAISDILKTEMNYFLTGIPNSRVVLATHILDNYIEAFKFINSLSPKQKQVFSDMLTKLTSKSSNKQPKK
ncbi:MAG: helix-turn-helix transcriptional regulator [Alphaproteobacteria bacterium]|nr:helix-turn-helix transcriptional regulator [Alphaproteobacteria bacterium]